MVDLWSGVVVVVSLFDAVPYDPGIEVYLVVEGVDRHVN